jgi:hypothetical protein
LYPLYFNFEKLYESLTLNKLLSAILKVKK